jgi:hypothetical protein
VLALGVEFRPGVNKVADVSALEREHLSRLVGGLHTLKFFVNHGNEDVDVDEVGDKRVHDPENVAHGPGLSAVVHDSVPRLARHAPEQSDHRVVKRIEVGLRVYNSIGTLSNFAEKVHCCYCERKYDEQQQHTDVDNVVKSEVERFEQTLETLGGFDHPQKTRHPDNPENSGVEQRARAFIH